jgi:alpha-beta hydrolase superfamily lysophospholipase
VSAPGSRLSEATGFFQSTRDHRLFFRSWRSPSERAILILVHGIGEHSGRYERLAQELRANGVSVFAHDLRGHGRSSGRRGHISRFDDFTSDLRDFHAHVRQMAGEMPPIFLMGHSLGGLISLRCLQQYPEMPWRGAILSAPALGLRMQVPLWKRVAARVLSTGLPWLALDSGIDAADLSHDPEIVEAYLRDPLVHRRISARLFAEMQTASATAGARMAEVAVPNLLLLLPLDDRICDPDASREVAARLPSATALTVHEYADAYHEVLNETCREQVVRDLLDWLEDVG